MNKCHAHWFSLLSNFQGCLRGASTPLAFHLEERSRGSNWLFEM